MVQVEVSTDSQPTVSPDSPEDLRRSTGFGPSPSQIFLKHLLRGSSSFVSPVLRTHTHEIHSAEDPKGSSGTIQNHLPDVRTRQYHRHSSLCSTCLVEVRGGNGNQYNLCHGRKVLSCCCSHAMLRTPNPHARHNPYAPFPGGSDTGMGFTYLRILCSSEFSFLLSLKP